MIFLIVLAFIWLIIASYLDLKKREIPNWLNFSLVIFALAYRAFYASINSDLWFFINGLIGFGILFIIANLFYYGRVFAGGDAKLLMALGVILPFSSLLVSNLVVLAVFVFLLLLSGSIYGLLYSFVLVLMNKKKFSAEVKKQFKKKKKIFKLAFLFFIAFFIIVFLLNFYLGEISLFVLPFLILLYPFLFVYAKAVEESCMIKLVNTKDLTEGDWLYQAVKFKGRKIIPNWEGLSLEEIKLLKKGNKKVLVKQGIPFVPSFLIAFLLLILGYSKILYGFFVP